MFLAVALASIVLVGAGVLVFSAIGARAEATERVEQQLEVVASLETSLEQSGSPLAERFTRAFDAEQVAIVLVDDRGEVRVITRGENGRITTPRVVEVVLDDEQLMTFQTGEPLIVDGPSTVIGLQRIGSDEARPGTPGLLIRQSVSRVPEQAVRWFLISAAVVIAGAAAAAAWLARRIVTPIREIEQATSAIAGGDLATRLDVRGDDEIAQLAAAVNGMTNDLDRSRSLEQQFLLSVSHDLRTPLTAIRGYAEALVDGAAADPTDAGAVISRHADRLDRLVRDLLELARLDAHSFQIESEAVDPAAIAGRVAEGFNRTAADTGVTINVRAVAGSTISVDPTRLEQILANLVENAIKFADATIDVVVDANIPDRVVMSVIDDGPGIDAEDLPHVFERLYVTQREPKRAESSSGLGLAIVRELATAMGGTVAAAPRADGVSGTSMSVIFPVLSAAQSAERL